MVSMRLNLCVVALVWCASYGVHAASPAAATVEGVQLPAWVERGATGARQPLAPGAVLASQDKVLTGPNARLLLRMADGSTVKLGEKARLNFNRAEASTENNEITLRASLNLVVGAFRFTTDALNKLRSKREVDIKISTVTAGIRGTDVWSAQRPDREIVCLLEGKISVDRELNNATESVVLDQPLQFYIALKDKPANPIGFITPEQIAQWSQETELTAGQAVLRAGGKYKVIFVTSQDIADAFKAYDELRAAGYPASIAPVQGKRQHSYQVLVAGLENEVAAHALMASLSKFDKARVVH